MRRPHSRGSCFQRATRCASRVPATRTAEEKPEIWPQALPDPHVAGGEPALVMTGLGAEAVSSQWGGVGGAWWSEASGEPHRWCGWQRRQNRSEPESLFRHRGLALCVTGCPVHSPWHQVVGTFPDGATLLLASCALTRDGGAGSHGDGKLLRPSPALARM